MVLPGGDGSADFHPFVKRIFKNAVPEGYVLAQPIAVKWSDKQEIVWPTAKNRVEKMKFYGRVYRCRYQGRRRQV